MEKKQLFTVTDLGGGDGGKGGVVHKVCVVKKAHTVVKVGGAQGSHGVRTSAGQSFNFSQFGCGTFEGVKTHISNLMVMEPYRLLAEANQLRYGWGIHNIFDYLTVDENSLCSTPYHNMVSQLKELLRKDNSRGTVGTGVGEAYLDAQIHPQTAIYAKHLNQPNLALRLRCVQNQKIEELEHLLFDKDAFLPEDRKLATNTIELLYDPNFTDRILETWSQLTKAITVVPSDYLGKNILSKPGTVVVESSHGILTDRYYGFHPHTTKLRTIPQGTIDLLKEHNYDGEIFKLGVTRGYQIRHGAGPMVTESPELLESLLPGSNKDENRWQGKVRVGSLDLVALQYAIDVCGGPSFFDGLAISWFDQIQVVGRWDICKEYDGAIDSNFFSPNGGIKVRRGCDEKQLQYQEQLGELLRNCCPKITSYNVASKTQGDLIQLCSQVLEGEFRIPVAMISFGSTEKDKICL
jgi:adenylosuccinate synthase